MDMREVREKFKTGIKDIVEMCSVSDAMFDKEMFQIYIATIWGNAVLDPERNGIEEQDLPLLHDFLNEELQALLNPDSTVSSCYEFIISEEGEKSIKRLRLARQHQDFLHYFARLILPQGMNE